MDIKPDLQPVQSKKTKTNYENEITKLRASVLAGNVSPLAVRALLVGNVLPLAALLRLVAWVLLTGNATELGVWLVGNVSPLARVAIVAAGGMSAGGETNASSDISNGISSDIKNACPDKGARILFLIAHSCKAQLRCHVATHRV